MATVHFAPYKAVKYVGSKAKELTTSSARPKPILKKGDIVIVDKRTGFNMVHKGFGLYEDVENISFVKADKETAATIQELQEKIASLNEEIELLQSQLPPKDEVIEQDEDTTSEDVNTEDNGK